MSLSNVIPIHFLLIIAYSLMPQTSTGENAEKMVNNNIVNAYTEFGFDLYKKEIITHKDENIFISPVSVSLALAMTSGGSEGETEKAILKTLNLEGIKRETLGSANKNLISNLLKDDKDVELSIANSIWLKKGVNFYEKFKTDTENYFFADLFSLTTADPINEWVEKKTNGRIKDIIESVSPADIAYLVNAIYFKGSWAEEFDRKLTKPKSFYLKGGEEIKVDMMKRKDRFKYLKTEEFEAVTIPYGDGKTSISLFLPDKDSCLDTFRESLSYKSWKRWRSDFRKREGTVELPKLRIEYKSKLNSSLSALGMEIAFSPSDADFSRMCRIDSKLNVYISKVLHKTFLKMDEKGTEAAAATSVGLTLTSTAHKQPEPFHIVFNRPYFLVITENSNSLPLFIGSVQKPPKSNSD